MCPELVKQEKNKQNESPLFARVPSAEQKCLRFRLRSHPGVEKRQKTYQRGDNIHRWDVKASGAYDTLFQPKHSVITLTRDAQALTAKRKQLKQ